LGYFIIKKHKNTQEAKRLELLGTARRAPPPKRISPAVSSLLARFAKHAGLPDAKI
jgi:hypothetical protein